MPKFIRKLNIKHGEHLRLHIMDTIVEIVLDIPFFIMGLMLIPTVYMPILTIYKLVKAYQKDPVKFTSEELKKIIQESFISFFSVHIPIFIMETIIIAVSFINLWRIKSFIIHSRKMLSFDCTTSEVAEFLGEQIKFLISDLVHLPLLIISFVNLFNLPTTYYIYKVNILLINANRKRYSGQVTILQYKDALFPL